MAPSDDLPVPRVGDRYLDKMCKMEMVVTDVTDDRVFIVAARQQDSDARGSPYPREVWLRNVAAGRFKWLDPIFDAHLPSEPADTTEDTTPATPADSTGSSALEW